MFDEPNPRQAILVTSRAETEILGRKMHKDNIFALTWHTPVSFDPKLYVISVGKERFSAELIEKARCFCVNFISPEYEKDLLFCGRSSGKTIDKFEKTRFEKEECSTIDCPRIKQAVGYMECEVIDQKEVGDHILFIGKVLKGSAISSNRLFYLGNEKFTTMR